MSYSVNEVELIGRVGRIDELKNVGGKPLINFSLATSYGKGDQERTDWHQISAWEKLADNVVNYFHVGDLVRVKGRISYNIVGEGESRKTYTQISAGSLMNLTPKKAENSNTTGNYKQAGTKQTTVSAVPDDEIPF